MPLECISAGSCIHGVHCPFTEFKNPMSPLSLLFGIVLLGRSIDAVSVCDEVDVVFLIDTASIIHNEENIIKLIDSIIVNGSSEFTGFSAVSYGHHLPLTADSVLFHLDDTKHIAHRRETQQVVHEELENSFESIKGAVQSKSGHTVSVLDALHHGQSQHSPSSEYRKHHLLREATDYTMGEHDDDTIFIVFDWTNQLLSNHEICEMYEMTDGEKDHFYFLFGQHLDESIGINCHREGGGILNYGHSFHHFDEEQFVEDTQVMFCPLLNPLLEECQFTIYLLFVFEPTGYRGDL